MTEIELLTVEQVFSFKTRMVIVPDFSVPKAGWNNALTKC